MASLTAGLTRALRRLPPWALPVAAAIAVVVVAVILAARRKEGVFFGRRGTLPRTPIRAPKPPKNAKGKYKAPARKQPAAGLGARVQRGAPAISPADNMIAGLQQTVTAMKANPGKYGPEDVALVQVRINEWTKVKAVEDQIKATTDTTRLVALTNQASRARQAANRLFANKNQMFAAALKLMRGT